MEAAGLVLSFLAMAGGESEAAGEMGFTELPGLAEVVVASAFVVAGVDEAFKCGVIVRVPSIVTVRG